MRTKEDKAFTAKCDQCQLSKADLNYFDLKDFGEPFYSASVGKESIWGWNSEHLAMVIDYLEGKDIGNNRWRIYKQFVPGSWKRPSRRIAFIKAARKVLNDP